MTDSDAIATLKLQLELERMKAKRAERELIMQRERVTLLPDQSNDLRQDQTVTMEG